MSSSTSSSGSTTTQAIDTPPLKVTTVAQVSGAITALGAAAIALYQTFADINATDPIKIALIGLVGAGILAWAIAAAGDTLARAYAAAHVTRTEPEKVNQPAIQAAAIRLADVYAAAHGVKLAAPTNPTDGGASTGTASVYSPPATTAPKECYLEFSPPLKVKVRDKDAQAVAVLISGQSGKEPAQKYLVGLPGSQLGWESNDAISLPPVTSEPVAKPTPVATPATVSSGGTSQPDNGSTAG